MTIEQVIEVLSQRAEVLQGELQYYHPFSSQWEEFYGRQSEVYGIISLLQGGANTNGYLNQAIEERISDDD